MILWLALYALVSFGQDQSIEEYCFSSPAKMQEVHARLKFILVPVDKTQMDKSCFTVSTPPHRRELIQSYVRRLEPGVSIGYSSAEIRKEHCKIKVEKTKNTVRQNTQVGVGQELSAVAQQSNSQAKETSTIQTMQDFELQVNQDSIKGTCRVITPNRYEIQLEVKKEAKPLAPGVPPGTVVIVPDAQIPKNQETSRLQTTVQLNRGEQIEIGSIVKNLKNNSNSADISPRVEVDATQGQENEIVTLSID